jgi:hypothetical protein
VRFQQMCSQEPHRYLVGFRREETFNGSPHPLIPVDWRRRFKSDLIAGFPPDGAFLCRYAKRHRIETAA